MLDKDELMANLNRLEIDLADTYAIIGKIKDAFADTIAENAQLRLENDRLHFRLEEMDKKDDKDEKDKNKLSTSLLKIYDEGFHVCHTYYGKVLEEQENCLLCQEVLFR
ncbi:MAG: initiation control protein YabA [Lactovum sp.]